MESTLSSTTTLFAISKSMKSPLFPISSTISRRLAYASQPPPPPPPISSLRISAALSLPSSRRLHGAFSPSSAVASIRYLSAVFPHTYYRLACISGSASFFPSAGGGAGGGSLGGKGGGGNGGGPHDRDAKVAAASGGDVSELSSDVIILDVRGMTCGGCAASVKRILESQPQVSSANVNLTTETAIVWPVSEAKTAPDWQKQIGEMLAMHLTTCGFESSLRGLGVEEGDIQL